MRSVWAHINVNDTPTPTTAHFNVWSSALWHECVYSFQPYIDDSIWPCIKILRHTHTQTTTHVVYRTIDDEDRHTQSHLNPLDWNSWNACVKSEQIHRRRILQLNLNTYSINDIISKRLVWVKNNIWLKFLSLHGVCHWTNAIMCHRLLCMCVFSFCIFCIVLCILWTAHAFYCPSKTTNAHK